MKNKSSRFIHVTLHGAACAENHNRETAEWNGLMTRVYVMLFRSTTAKFGARRRASSAICGSDFISADIESCLA